jgi:hypothetical protein
MTHSAAGHLIAGKRGQEANMPIDGPERDRKNMLE